jgi:hypothetical protein
LLCADLFLILFLALIACHLTRLQTFDVARQGGSKYLKAEALMKGRNSSPPCNCFSSANFANVSGLSADAVSATSQPTALMFAWLEVIPFRSTPCARQVLGITRCGAGCAAVASNYYQSASIKRSIVSKLYVY